MRLQKPLLTRTIFLPICIVSKAQDSSKLDKAISISNKFFSALDKKTTSIESKLDKKIDQYLSKLQKKENKLKKKLWKKDSVLAKEFFDEGRKITFNLNSTNNAIDNIKIYGVNGTLIKHVQLLRSNGNLMDVRFKNVNGTVQGKYTFEYAGGGRPGQADYYSYLASSGGGIVPQFTGTFNTSKYGWTATGYYPDGMDLYPFPPQPLFTLGTVSFPVSDPGYGKLTKITFPTGVSAEYFYQLNTANYAGQNNTYSGDECIYMTKLRDNNGNILNRTYQSGTNACGYRMKTLLLANEQYYRNKLTAYEYRVFPWIQSGAGSQWSPREGVSFSQDSSRLVDKALSFPDKVFASLDTKTSILLFTSNHCLCNLN